MNVNHCAPAPFESCVDCVAFEPQPPITRAAPLHDGNLVRVVDYLRERGYVDIHVDYTDVYRPVLHAWSPPADSPDRAHPRPAHEPAVRLPRHMESAEVDRGPISDYARHLVYPFGFWLYTTPEGRLCAMNSDQFLATHRKAVQDDRD